MTSARRARTATCVASALLLSALLSGCPLGDTDHLAKGRDLLKRGDTTAAVIELKNAVQDHPDAHAARVALAEALTQAGDLAGAEEHYSKALAAGGDANDLSIRIVQLLLDRNDAPTLIKAFGTRKLDNAEADSNLRAALALAYMATGQSERVQSELSQAKHVTQMVQIARAQAALQAQDVAGASAALQAMGQPAAGQWWALRAAARAHDALGQREQAGTLLTAAYRAAPWHQGIIGEQAERWIQQGKLDEARPLVSQLKKLAPTYYRTAYLDARLAMAEGKPDRAYPLVLKVLAALPQHLEAQVMAATIEYSRRQYAQAERRVNQVLKERPQDLQALLLRANLALATQQHGLAEATVRTGLALAPQEPRFLVLDAELAWRQGKQAAALQKMKEAVQRPPRIPSTLARLAEMQLRMGQQAEAVSTLQEAAKLAGQDPASNESILNTAIQLKQFAVASQIVASQQAARPKHPQPLLWQAVILGEQGQNEAALAQLDAALKLQPDYHPALVTLSKLARTPEARKAFQARLDAALAANSRDSRVYLMKLEQLRAAGADFKQQQEVIRQGLAMAPGTFALHKAAIELSAAQGNWEQAKTLAQEGEAALPQDTEMLRLAAAVYDKAGARDQAFSRYAQLIKLAPDSDLDLLRYTSSLTEANKLPLAIDKLKQFIADHPDVMPPYLALSRLQARQGKADQALATARQLQAKYRAEGLLLEGDLLAEQGRQGDALAAYAAAAQAGGGEQAVQHTMSLHDRAGQADKAEAALNAWLKAHPDSVPVLAAAAKRASEKGDYVAATKYLQGVAKKDPRNPVALNDLAWAQVLARQPQALDTARQALALAPDDINVLDTLSQAQLLAGDRKAAEATLRDILTREANNPTAKLHLAEILQSQGNKGDASKLVAGIDARGLDREGNQRLNALRKAL